MLVLYIILNYKAYHHIGLGALQSRGGLQSLESFVCFLGKVIERKINESNFYCIKDNFQSLGNSLCVVNHHSEQRTFIWFCYC